MKRLSVGIQASKIVSALVLAACAAGSALAATQTLNGTTFDVQYDDALLGLFGTPSLLGDTIVFTPTNFRAESLNGQGFATANSTINLKILPHTGQDLVSVVLTERGDYVLEGAGSFVRVTGQLRSFDLGNPLYEVTDTITVLPSTPLNLLDGQLHNWVAEASLDYASDANLADTRGVNLTVQNNLRAFTPTGTESLAYIEKKFAGDTITVVVTTVPEPSSVALFALGAAGLAARSHTRSQKRSRKLS